MKRFRRALKRWSSAALLFVSLRAAESGADPQFTSAGPAAAEHGEAQGYPVGDAHTWNKAAYVVGSYSHFDAIFPARGVPHPRAVWPFRREASEPAISYEYNGHTDSLNEYMTHVPVTGLLIGRDDDILVERYQYGRTDRDRFTSASMAKTMVAMLLGIASEGNAKFSIDRNAGDYVPGLQHSAYGATTLRDLLHMTSGVLVNDGVLLHRLYARRVTDDAEVLAGFDARVTKPGVQFHYSCGDSEALGLVVYNLTGKSLAAYLSEKIWQPIGAEEDASWSIDTAGEEVTCFGLNATLGDWGRVGRLLADDGTWNGRQIIPRQWMIDATTIRPSDVELEPGRASERFGYGYQVWILPGPRRMFALMGADSQFLLVDPASKLYMVQTAASGSPTEAEMAETLSLWAAVVKELGG